MTELTAALNQSAEENEALKVRYQILEIKHDQSQREAAKKIQLGKEERVKLAHPVIRTRKYSNIMQGK